MISPVIWVLVCLGSGLRLYKLHSVLKWKKLTTYSPSGRTDLLSSVCVLSILKVVSQSQLPHR